MFVDVQQDLLFGMVVAWENNFTGSVLDYFAFPDQQRPYFTLRDARNTLAIATGKPGVEGSIYAGLDEVTRRWLGRTYRRDDQAELRIEKCLIDANWGTSTDVVYQFCRESPFAALIMPSHGRFVGAASKPYSEYRRIPGEFLGINWHIPNLNGRRAVRHVSFDSNYWKSFVHSRLKLDLGEPGNLSFFGDHAGQHRLLAEHLTAEYRVRTAGRGRTVDEWKIRPERSDNHWLDCLVGCAVAASIIGVHLPETGTGHPPQRERVSLAALRDAARRANVNNRILESD